MTTVFVTHPVDRLGQYFGERALRELRGMAQVRLNPHDRELETSELVAAAQGCDAIIAYRQTPAPRLLFESLPGLAAFLRCAVDIRTVDVDAASDHGVLVTRASAGYVPAVCEWIVAAMVDVGRGMSRHAADYWAGRPPRPAMGMQLRGATLGIVGHGRIGSALVDLGQALGMRVLVSTPQDLAARPGMRHVAFDTLLAQSDFVVCLAPANTDTENLMDARAFAAMKPGAFFVNASRGELVDEAALLAALEGGRLGGCALDVGRAADQMPSPALARHPLVVASPHIGGLTLPAIEHQALETVSQLQALVGGTMPDGAVNAPAATRHRRLAQGSAAA